MTTTTKQRRPLTVYKASAGSGKTFTLAVEYISLLVSDPENYRHILAVTFTNKATQEMKLRILSQLYGIANSLPGSDTYMEKVMEQTGLGAMAVRTNARQALSLLTHHYNFFRVQTIDAFFQGVLRNLAHELDLTANLRVDLNDNEVEGKAVDEMIETLDANPEVMGWVRDYINQNIEDEQGWNVIGRSRSLDRTSSRTSTRIMNASSTTCWPQKVASFFRGTRRYCAVGATRYASNWWIRHGSWWP